MEIGFVAIIFGLAVPNLRSTATGYLSILRSTKVPYKHREIDRSQVGTYVRWVIGLTLMFGVYNFIVAQSFLPAAETTGAELFFLSVGLVNVILYKKKNGKKDKKTAEDD